MSLSAEVERYLEPRKNYSTPLLAFDLVNNFITPTIIVKPFPNFDEMSQVLFKFSQKYPHLQKTSGFTKFTSELTILLENNSIGNEYARNGRHLNNARFFALDSLYKYLTGELEKGEFI